ncbi:hypothetical protein [Rugamonas fusca]|uniref:hypothetical protein n=1 Tax=Rugamonas fusca TaxID=2758568 RepID=UPI001E5FA0B3|nr:hypothetical protein [Rugamonas fusca]
MGGDIRGDFLIGESLMAGIAHQNAEHHRDQDIDGQRALFFHCVPPAYGWERASLACSVVVEGDQRPGLEGVIAIGVPGAKTRKCDS